MRCCNNLMHSSRMQCATHTHTCAAPRRNALHCQRGKHFIALYNKTNETKWVLTCVYHSRHKTHSRIQFGALVYLVCVCRRSQHTRGPNAPSTRSRHVVKSMLRGGTQTAHSHSHTPVFSGEHTHTVRCYTTTNALLCNVCTR